MNKVSILKQIKKLRHALAHHDSLYYQKTQPEISDFEYDCLKQELQSLEHQYPDFASLHSPTQTVGDDRVLGFEKHRHIQPMLSLSNTYSEKELRDFDYRICKMLDVKELEYIVEPKIDGVAVSLVYEKGILTRVLTRGNGVEGDIITDNIKGIASIPSALNQNGIFLKQHSLPALIEIRGEVYMSYAEFNRINQERKKQDLPLYANPRNLAAGSIKLLDRDLFKSRKIDAFFYGVGGCDPMLYNKQSDFLDFLKSVGFPVSPYYEIAKGVDAVWQAIQSIYQYTQDLPFATDGAVVKVNAFSGQGELGSTAKSPRWAIAYKFSPEQAETELYGITIQVGRTGVLTPVAELKPLQLSGSIIARATLHNADEIARKDIRIGDTVVIEKAGEVIPAVIKVVYEKRPSSAEAFVFPSLCPACGASVHQLHDKVAWRCMNTSCPPQIRRRIVHYGCRKAMNIENLGTAVVDQLVSNGLIFNIADLYALTVDQLLPLNKFAQKSAENLIYAIEKSKQRELWRLIHGLGIQHIGEQSAKDIARHFRSLQRFMEATEKDLTAIDGIGPILAESIRHFFTEPSNQELIQRLIGCGIRMQDPIERLTPQAMRDLLGDASLMKGLDQDLQQENRIPKESNSGEYSAIFSQSPLFGKTFVITGTLPSMSREEAKFIIEQAGGKVSSGISKKTHFLLIGENPGSKYEKALSLNISIIRMTDLYDMLKA